MNEYWGYHLQLDAHDCDRALMTDRQHVDTFTRDLVKRIDMKAYGDPHIVKFGTGNKEGFTMFQLIETSNICAHMCDESGDIYLDVFSCKPFEQEVVEQCFYEYFKPQKFKTNFMTRQAG